MASLPASAAARVREKSSATPRSSARGSPAASEGGRTLTASSVPSARSTLVVDRHTERHEIWQSPARQPQPTRLGLSAPPKRPLTVRGHGASAKEHAELHAAHSELHAAHAEVSGDLKVAELDRRRAVLQAEQERAERIELEEKVSRLQALVRQFIAKAPQLRPLAEGAGIEFLEADGDESPEVLAHAPPPKPQPCTKDAQRVAQLEARARMLSAENAQLAHEVVRARKAEAEIAPLRVELEQARREADTATGLAADGAEQAEQLAEELAAVSADRESIAIDLAAACRERCRLEALLQTSPIFDDTATQIVIDFSEEGGRCVDSVGTRSEAYRCGSNMEEVEPLLEQLSELDVPKELIFKLKKCLGFKIGADIGMAGPLITRDSEIGKELGLSQLSFDDIKDGATQLSKDIPGTAADAVPQGSVCHAAQANESSLDGTSSAVQRLVLDTLKPRSSSVARGHREERTSPRKPSPHPQPLQTPSGDGGIVRGKDLDGSLREVVQRLLEHQGRLQDEVMQSRDEHTVLIESHQQHLREEVAEVRQECSQVTREHQEMLSEQCLQLRGDAADIWSDYATVCEQQLQGHAQEVRQEFTSAVEEHQNALEQQCLRLRGEAAESCLDVAQGCQRQLDGQVLAAQRDWTRVSEEHHERLKDHLLSVHGRALHACDQYATQQQRHWHDELSMLQVKHLREHREQEEELSERSHQLRQEAAELEAQRRSEPPINASIVAVTMFEHIRQNIHERAVASLDRARADAMEKELLRLAGKTRALPNTPSISSSVGGSASSARGPRPSPRPSPPKRSLLLDRNGGCSRALPIIGVASALACVGVERESRMHSRPRRGASPRQALSVLSPRHSSSLVKRSDDARSSLSPSAIELVQASLPLELECDDVAKPELAPALVSSEALALEVAELRSKHRQLEAGLEASKCVRRCVDVFLEREAEAAAAAQRSELHEVERCRVAQHLAEVRRTDLENEAEQLIRRTPGELVLRALVAGSPASRASGRSSSGSASGVSSGSGRSLRLKPRRRTRKRKVLAEASQAAVDNSTFIGEMSPPGRRGSSYSPEPSRVRVFTHKKTSSTPNPAGSPTPGARRRRSRSVSAFRLESLTPVRPLHFETPMRQSIQPSTPHGTAHPMLDGFFVVVANSDGASETQMCWPESLQGSRLEEAVVLQGFCPGPELFGLADPRGFGGRPFIFSLLETTLNPNGNPSGMLYGCTCSLDAEEQAHEMFADAAALSSTISVGTNTTSGTRDLPRSMSGHDVTNVVVSGVLCLISKLPLFNFLFQILDALRSALAMPNGNTVAATLLARVNKMGFSKRLVDKGLDVSQLLQCHRLLQLQLPQPLPCDWPTFIQALGDVDEASREPSRTLAQWQAAWGLEQLLANWDSLVGDTLARLLACLLLEQKVLLLGDAPRISTFALVLRALIWPFKWLHPFLPAPPPKSTPVANFLDAPFPLIIALAELPDGFQTHYHLPSEVVTARLKHDLVYISPELETTGGLQGQAIKLPGSRHAGFLKQVAQSKRGLRRGELDLSTAAQKVQAAAEAEMQRLADILQRYVACQVKDAEADRGDQSLRRFQETCFHRAVVTVSFMQWLPANSTKDARGPEATQFYETFFQTQLCHDFLNCEVISQTACREGQ